MNPTGPYAAQRVAYSGVHLEESDLAATPLEQFDRWYADALGAAVAEPNAMVLATVAADGAPSARTVLLKGIEPRGFVFFTNTASRKGREVALNPRVAAVFPWHAIQRQVAVRGRGEPLPAAESAEYFASRPWGSRIGAWASRQSQPVSARGELEDRFAELARRWPDHGRPDDVPKPDHWGGYVIRPVEIEFWQGRPSRLHDRLVFVATSGAEGSGRLDDPAAWRVERRQP